MKGNLAEIQPKNHQNVQKTHFLQKVPGVFSSPFQGTAASKVYLATSHRQLYRSYEKSPTLYSSHLNTERAYKRSAVCTLFASFAPRMAAFCDGHYRYKSSAKSVVVCFQKLYIKLFVHNPNDLLSFSKVS